MSVIRVATNFNIDLEFTAAPFGRRLIAWALDLLLQVFYLIIASRFLRWLMLHLDPTSDNDYNLWAIVLILLLPFFLYHFVCEVFMNGQSVGKSILGIRVVNHAGGRPSLSQFIIRWLIRTSDYTVLLFILYAPYTMMFGAGFVKAMGASLLLLLTDLVLVNTTRNHQRLGDLLAHTMLIATRLTGTIEDTLFLSVADDYVPRFPQVMQLSDRDINSLKGLLDTANRRHDVELADRAAAKIKNHLSIQTDISAFAFLETLLKDYNYLSTRYV
jgi:uncharacterized RDD family membrane protein YckC